MELGEAGLNLERTTEGGIALKRAPSPTDPRPFSAVHLVYRSFTVPFSVPFLEYDSAKNIQEYSRIFILHCL